jgi:hypothetical protein
MRSTSRAVPLALLLALATALALAPAGCGPRRPDDGAVFRQQQPEAVIAVVIDTSGSFAGRLDEAYAFFAVVADEYFRASQGGHSELVISQISGAGKPALLWRGPPADLRKKFPSASDFRAFMFARSDPAGSAVHDALADTVDEVLSRPGVAEGKTRSAILLLSDMQDNVGSADSLQRATDRLRAYRAAKGSVGIYWCDQDLARDWRTRLKDAGFDGTNSVLETSIASRPPLPRLDD